MKIDKEKLEIAAEPQENHTDILSGVSQVIQHMSDLCVIFTVVICLIFSVFTVPRLFDISPFVVQSASMEPTIPTGSVVFVNTKDTDVKEGDIITYSLSVGENKGVFVTHRVHKMDTESGLIQTKGDNNDNADGWIDGSAVVGTVLNYLPWCGFVLDSLQRAGFVIIAIWMFAVNLILMMVPYIIRTIRNLSENT